MTGSIQMAVKFMINPASRSWLTGLNWFGYNTGTNTFDGLWNSELVSSVKAIADHGFNLIKSSYVC